MVSFRRVLRKFTSFKMCGFDGSERVHARWTPLIWISLITFLTAARPVLPSVAEPRSRARASVSRALHVECFCFRWFIWLLSFVRFLFVCLAFLFDRVFITVFGQNQNWSKHGCRLTFAVGCVCMQQGWQHWPLDIFGLFLSVLFGSTVAVELLLAFCYDFCYF